MNSNMDDPTNTRDIAEFGPTDTTGVTIIGAQPARAAVESATSTVQSATQWADDDETGHANEDAIIDLESPPLSRGQLSLADLDDEEGIDSAWMDAGDTTLGDLLGHVPPRVTEVHLPDAPVTDEPVPNAGSFAAQLGDRLSEIKTPVAASSASDADSDSDDVFPDHMYTSSFTSSVGEDTGVIVASAAATLEQRERRLAERRSEDRSDSASGSSLVVDDAPSPKAARSAEDADDDRWGAFAGGAPRWRDDAKDWADVDSADASLLGDDETRVGTLQSNRSEQSDLYTISSDASTSTSTDTTSKSGSETSTAIAKRTDDLDTDDAAAKATPSNVLRFDSLSRGTDADAGGKSGGSQQRLSSRRGSAKADAAAKQVSTSGSNSGPGSGSAKSSAKSSGKSSGNPSGAKAGSAKQATQTSLSARIGTGLLLVLFVGLVFTFAKAVGAAVLAAVAIAMAAIELMHALRERGFRPAIPPVAVGLVAVVGAGMWRGERGVLVAIVLSVMTIASWYLFGAERERPAVNMAASLLSFGYPAIAAATAALLLHARDGLGLLMPAIVCTVAHDVFAYAGGRLIGRTHFTDISPNKTVEGLVVGVLGSIGAAAVLYGRFGLSPWGHSYPQAIALGLVVGLAAPVGDLVESLLKRDLNIKDMGHLLPGHGGVFDRIDAMLLAVPAVWLVALATNHL